MRVIREETEEDTANLSAIDFEYTDSPHDESFENELALYEALQSIHWFPKL